MFLYLKKSKLYSHIHVTTYTHLYIQPKDLFFEKPKALQCSSSTIIIMKNVSSQLRDLTDWMNEWLTPASIYLLYLLHTLQVSACNIAKVKPILCRKNIFCKQQTSSSSFFVYFFLIVQHKASLVLGDK